MRKNHFWLLVLLMMASLQITACTSESASANKIAPAKVEAIGDTKLNRLVLTKKATERVGIQTVPIQEQTVERTRLAGGEITSSGPAAGGNSSPLLVRVSLNTSDLNKVDRNRPVTLQTLARNGGSAGSVGQPAQAPPAWVGMAVRPANGPTGIGSARTDSTKGDSILYYALSGEVPGLTVGQRVGVELPLLGNGSPRLVIPYSAVVYDLQGDTWTYISMDPLTFVRHHVVVDFIQGDLAVLKEGPAKGTAVVTSGAAELYGTEFGVGK